MAAALNRRPNRLLRAINSLAPNCTYGKAIVQLFLHGPERRTTYTFTNVASLYAPKGAVGCSYELTLFGEHGEQVGRTEVAVPAFGAATVELANVLSGTMPRHGIVVARLRNAPRINLSARHLGAITPHFYALYHAPDMASLALIHPQSGIEEHTRPDHNWRSNLQIEVDGLDALEACQINPTPHSVRTTIEMWAGDTCLDSLSSTLPPMGSQQVRFNRAVLERAAHPVHFAVKGMTAPNAKPLVFHHHAVGGFSASHS